MKRTKTFTAVCFLVILGACLLAVLAGAAMVCTRAMASSRSRTILLQPTITSTWAGPKAMAATRLELPSTLYSLPSSVTALLLVRYQSALNTRR